MGKEGKRLKGLKRCSTSTDGESSDHKEEKPLQIAESELQNPETDVKEVKRLKRCSTATDAESSDHKDKKPLQIAHVQIAESELENPETDVKKQKKRKKKSKSKQIDEDDLEAEKTSDKKEMKKLRKSFNEMTQTMKNLQALFGSKSDPPGMSLSEMLLKMGPPPNTSSKKKEEPPKELETYECCFETEDSHSYRDSIFVHGFDTNLTRDVIKSALRTHFESCGLEVQKVFVPIECKTGVPLGYAFIDVDDDQKALKLCGGLVMGRWLYVLMAEHQTERAEFPNFKGCRRCGFYLGELRQKRFQEYLSSYGSLHN